MGIQTVKDMLAFNQATAFTDERAKRVDLIKNELLVGIPAVDFAFKSILPNDLICIAAKTGSGKTEMLTQIAVNVALQGKRVDFFALEASEYEIHRRIKYKVLAELYTNANHDPSKISYSSWVRLRCDTLFAPFEMLAEEKLAKIAENLNVYYRSAAFDVKDFLKLYQTFVGKSHLVLADHAQFFQKDDKQNDIEHVRGMTLAMFDMVNKFRVPIILVSHLRKLDSDKQFPDESDLYGASELTKIATRLMIICRDRKRVDLNSYETVFRIPKNREEAPTSLRVNFSLTTKKYSDKFQEGQIVRDKFLTNEELLKT